jgi:hypothetical protein
MAERGTRKGKRPAPARRRSAAAGTKVAESARGAQKLEAVERERDQLKASLAEALAKIAQLEKARDEALNRIDWAIDSLHNVLESEA